MLCGECNCSVVDEEGRREEGSGQHGQRAKERVSDVRRE